MQTTTASPQFDANATNQADLPLPNVYFVSVQSATTNETHHLYIPADFSGSAFRKAANLCAERFHFRPYRSNSVVKMRRMKLSDYLENPQALSMAAQTAKDLGEMDTVKALAKRPQEIASLMEQRGEAVDFDALLASFREQLVALDHLPTKEVV